MNLLYSSTAYPPSMGGAQLLHHMMARSFQGRHRVQVVSQWKTNRSDWLLGTTLRAQKSADEYVIDGVSVHQLGLSRLEKLSMLPLLPIFYPLMSLALPPIALQLKKHLLPHARKADLIHNMRIGREGMSLASYQSARQYDIPFVFTPVHHPRWVGWRYQEYLNLYRRADAVIALTPTEKKTLVRLGVLENRIHVTGTGPTVADEAFPASFKISNGIDAPFILFLGQHFPYKGYQQLLEATSIVWRKFPDINFVFVGPAIGKSEILFKHFSDPRIKRLGKVSTQEKTDALAACTLLCVPSTQESFGSVYTEAWQFEKPVIGGNIPAISDVISDGIDGYLVEQKPTTIASRIIDLLDCPHRAATMGKAGKQKVEDHYTWQRLAAVLEKTYRTLI